MGKHVNYRNGEWCDKLWDFRESEFLDDPDDDIHCFLANKAESAAMRQESYDGYLDTDYWSKVRLKALTLANCKCSKCGSGSKLQVHHKHYCQRYTELENMHLLEVLCDSCHKQEHG
jgi:hypothetical protein